MFFSHNKLVLVGLFSSETNQRTGFMLANCLSTKIPQDDCWFPYLWSLPNKLNETGDHIQPVRLAGSYRCWFVKKYCWLIVWEKNTILTENLQSFTTSHSKTNCLWLPLCKGVLGKAGVPAGADTNWWVMAASSRLQHRLSSTIREQTFLNLCCSFVTGTCGNGGMQ